MEILFCILLSTKAINSYGNWHLEVEDSWLRKRKKIIIITLHCTVLHCDDHFLSSLLPLLFTPVCSLYEIADLCIYNRGAGNRGGNLCNWISF